MIPNTCTAWHNRVAQPVPCHRIRRTGGGGTPHFITRNAGGRGRPSLDACAPISPTWHTFLVRPGPPSIIERSADGRRVLDPRKLRLVWRIADMRERGMSLRKIADELNRRGVPSVNGGRWWPRTIALALRAAEEVGRR